MIFNRCASADTKAGLGGWFDMGEGSDPGLLSWFQIGVAPSDFPKEWQVRETTQRDTSVYELMAQVC